MGKSKIKLNKFYTMFKTTINMMLLSAAQNAVAHKMLGKPIDGGKVSDRPE